MKRLAGASICRERRFRRADARNPNNLSGRLRRAVAIDADEVVAGQHHGACRFRHALEQLPGNRIFAKQCDIALNPSSAEHPKGQHD
jgi:hypothetical protein